MMAFELDSAALTDLLAPSSSLAPYLKSFEHRPEQQRMLGEIVTTFNKGGLSLIEAGTGVGKSMAYLIPSLLWASQRAERIVISTHTIALQEQLIAKDLPDLIDALDIDIHVELVKGMHHYLCLSRLARAIDECPAFSPLGARLRAIEANGNCSLKQLQELPSLRCEGEYCNGGRCDFYNACHFFKARRRAEKAQVLIVNHHILLLDYLRRKQDPATAILPPYTKLIIDEAHHLEQAATSVFAKRLSIHELRTTLDHLLEQTTTPGIFDTTQQCIDQLGLFATPLNDKISFDAYTVPKNTQECIDHLRSLEVDLMHHSEQLKESEKTELMGFSKKCGSAAALLQELLLDPLESTAVRWVEPAQRNIPSFCEANIDTSEELRSFLQEAVSAVLCSATLSSSDTFDYIRERIGFSKEEVLIESRHPSPFDYANQAACLIPTDLPAPDSAHFVQSAAPLIQSLVETVGGGVFILCTSYRQLGELFHALEERLEKFTLLRQGSADRSALLQEFREGKNPVLFGTSSFWEGVDVAGKMRAVIIAKLPFQVPSEPLTLARYQFLEKQGKSAFTHHSLPEAVLRFIQGFGRLIRSKTDRGLCLCLDVRIYQKGYGKKFLKGMPAPIYFGTGEEIEQKAREFWASSAFQQTPV